MDTLDIKYKRNIHLANFYEELEIEDIREKWGIKLKDL